MAEVERPRALQAERAVLARVMKHGERAAGEVVGSLLPDDFFDGAHRALWEAILENYYADAPLDPLTIGQSRVKLLTHVWGVDDNEVMSVSTASPPPRWQGGSSTTPRPSATRRTCDACWS